MIQDDVKCVGEHIREEVRREVQAGCINLRVTCIQKILKLAYSPLAQNQGQVIHSIITI